MLRISCSRGSDPHISHASSSCFRRGGASAGSKHDGTLPTSRAISHLVAAAHELRCILGGYTCAGCPRCHIIHECNKILTDRVNGGDQSEKLGNLNAACLLSEVAGLVVRAAGCRNRKLHSASAQEIAQARGFGIDEFRSPAPTPLFCCGAGPVNVAAQRVKLCFAFSGKAPPFPAMKTVYAD